MRKEIIKEKWKGKTKNHSQKGKEDGMYEGQIEKGEIVYQESVFTVAGTPMRMLAILSNPTRARTPAPSSPSPLPPSSTARRWPGTRWRGGRKRRRWRGSEATSAPRPFPPPSSKPSCRKYPDWTRNYNYEKPSSKWMNSPLGVWKVPLPRGRTEGH